MNKKWKQIWEQKYNKASSEIEISLKKLISLNGFDTGVGSYDEENWLKSYKITSIILKWKILLRLTI